ncbi:hypothetical protein HIM_00310 [Hirsutella minnesotensis 3608]|nr:hypothetical protein HIM_00310 [Hirsutella minnesotensis 3608]
MPAPARRQNSPVHTAVDRWITSLQAADDSSETASWREGLLKSAPKRFTIYEPMALLPAGSFTGDIWAAELRRHGTEALARLWANVLEELSRNAKATLTHLAVNEGIPLQNNNERVENVRRSPCGLRMLHGDFGPGQTEAEPPMPHDFTKALWVSTKQNGIHQTWAPRWTMFSRGNVKEKARLLGFPSAKRDQGTTRTAGEAWAVDLYAGIGYFVFCYATLGMRVLCWEINPWSVEGLRRGARANRWTVKVVSAEESTRPLSEIVASGEQIVVFLESNEEALRRIEGAQAMGLARNIRHVNCGFLPTSEPIWKAAWDLARPSLECRLHLHENVGVTDIESRREAIQRRVADWAKTEGRGRLSAVEHVELVKTFAPGVWHCVFDVHVTRDAGES